MNSNPLVSIIITYYKKKNYIKETLDSIYFQDYKNYEIIFVYDDFEKYELNYVLKLLKKFNKKNIIINKKNYGVAKSRNFALKNCKGKYIAFIDSDDLWSKKKLSKQIKFMEVNDLKLSFTSYKIIDTNGKLIKKKIVTFDPTYDQLIYRNIIGLSTVMLDKQILNKVKFPSLTTQEDFAVWLKLSRKGYKLSHIPNTLSSWRKTQNSLSSNNLQKIADAFRLFYSLENKNLIFSIISVLVLGYNKLFK